MKKYGSRPGLKKIDTGVRKVAPTFGRAAFMTHVDEGGGTLVLDVDAERLGSHLLGFDPRVRRFHRQPLTVDLVEGRLLRTAQERDLARRRYAGRPGPSLYTPDFGVEHIDRKLFALEVKLKGFTGQEADRERMSQATPILKSYGYEFLVVVLPDDFSHPLHANIKGLHQADLRRDVRPAPEIIDHIELLAKDGARTVADYIHGLGISVDYLPSMLIHGALAMDIVTDRMEGRSAAEPAYGSLDHLELVERLAQ